MHRWLAGQLDALAGCRGKKINVIGPRGGAKSTLVTLAFVLRAALEGWEPYIWIVSDTRHQANSHLENIKAELAENRWLAERYGLRAVRWPVWRANIVQLPNGVRIEAFGIGQRLRGKRHRAARPSLIVCDDLQNDSHMESAHQRARSRPLVSRHAAQGRHARDASGQPGHGLASRCLGPGAGPDAGLDVANLSLDRALARRHGAVAAVGERFTPTWMIPTGSGTPGSSIAKANRRWTRGPNCCGPRKRACTR